MFTMCTNISCVLRVITTTRNIYSLIMTQGTYLIPQHRMKERGREGGRDGNWGGGWVWGLGWRMGMGIGVEDGYGDWGGGG